MVFLDAHAHLDLYRDGELDVALREIEQHRILTLSVAMDLVSYRRTREIARRCPFVLPTFGIHPWNAPANADHLGEFRQWVQQTPIIGEIGLDYHFVKDTDLHPVQREVFDHFLCEATAQGKIVNLHAKGAERDVIGALQAHAAVRAIVHWYSGPLDMLRELTATGAFVTVGIEVMYSEHIQRIAREIPAAQLLTETDNPGASRWLSDGFGTPAAVIAVVDKLAELRGQTREEMAALVRGNFLRLAGGDPNLADCEPFRLWRDDGA